MTINNLFTYVFLGSIALSVFCIAVFLFLSKKEKTQKNLLFKSISAWICLIGILTGVASSLYYQFGYPYKKSELPISYITKSKKGFPKDEYVITEMPNIPNTTPYGVVVFYDNSKSSQEAVKDVMKQFYESDDIAKSYLISSGFTPAISFVNINSELGKTYKNSIGKNVAEIVTTFTEGEQAGYADKTQTTELSAPSIVFYTNTGQLVSATKTTDVNGKYQKVVVSNAKTLYKEILSMNSSLSTQNTDTTQSSSTEETTSSSDK